MAEEFSLRCYCYLDRMQPQYAAFVGTITQEISPSKEWPLFMWKLSPGQRGFPRGGCGG